MQGKGKLELSVNMTRKGPGNGIIDGGSHRAISFGGRCVDDDCLRHLKTIKHHPSPRLADRYLLCCAVLAARRFPREACRLRTHNKSHVHCSFMHHFRPAECQMPAAQVCGGKKN